MRRTIVSVVGARPNFMKVAALEKEFHNGLDFDHRIVHTGQHYDPEISDVFFRQLYLSAPSWHLGVGSGNHGEMTGRIMIEFEKVCMEARPDMVVVVGDVNSTIAASLVARKMCIPVAHVEAGLRCFDESMPEELNRRLTDNLANLLFVSEPAGIKNLAREGIDSDRMHLVGDILLETLELFIDTILTRLRWKAFGLDKGAYALVTLRRPSNVDNPEALGEVIDMLRTIGMPSVFPLHPRTMKRICEFDLNAAVQSIPGLILILPESYIDFLSLLEGAALILSDSGSVQAEASFFNIPCLVCRENTERQIYLEHGTSVLVGRDKDRLEVLLHEISTGAFKESDPMIRQLGRGVAEKTVKTIDHFFRGAVAV